MPVNVLTAVERACKRAEEEYRTGQMIEEGAKIMIFWKEVSASNIFFFFFFFFFFDDDDD
jgi:hypothetical protein